MTLYAYSHITVFLTALVDPLCHGREDHVMRVAVVTRNAINQSFDLFCFIYLFILQIHLVQSDQTKDRPRRHRLPLHDDQSSRLHRQIDSPGQHIQQIPKAVVRKTSY